MNRQTHSREHMLAALSDARAYPHPTEGLVHLRTHISDVFLAGSYAYKVKKPINLGFLDFTTLSRRRRACEDEVRLNRRLAPQIYLGVVPIRRASGHYRVGGEPDDRDAKVVDYAVKMVRMPQESLLDQLADNGRLGREHMRDIARQIARFHEMAKRGPELDRYGSLECVDHNVRQNFAQTEAYIGRSISCAQFDQIKTYAEDFMRDNAIQFSMRISAGRIVDGHGDLHLRNMCLYHDTVIIFDCIEFNQQFRAGDVIGDIAFLTMDLDARTLPQLGNCFLSEYLQRTSDYAGLTMLDFYQVYRAYVRGKVASFLLDGDDGEAQRRAATSEAAHYFDLAQKYIAGHSGGLLITCGPSASGKTTVAQQTSEILRGVTVRSDAVRKHLAELPLEQHHAASYAQGIYNTEMTERTYQTLLQNARSIIGSGRWAVLDATYLRHAHRLQAAALARSLGVAFGIIYCNVPRSELERRLDQRWHTQKDISDATHAVLFQQLRDFEPPRRDEAAIFHWTGTEDLATWITQLAHTR